MTISKFVEKYNLHDSYFEELSFDDNSNSAELNINFAYWMQNWYKESMPENGMLKVNIQGIKKHNYENGIFNLETFGILKTTGVNDEINFELYDDMNDEFFELKIKASNVQVEEKLFGY